MKCSLCSKLVGLIATVLTETEPDGLIKTSPLICEIPLSAYTKVLAPVTNNTEEFVTLAEGVNIRKVPFTVIPFQLETDD